MKKPDGWICEAQEKAYLSGTDKTLIVGSPGTLVDQLDMAGPFKPVHLIDASEDSEFVVVPRKLVAAIKDRLWMMSDGDAHRILTELENIFPEAKADEK